MNGHSARRPRVGLLLAMAALVLAAHVAWADEDSGFPAAAPRTSLQIGDLSIVLIAANGKLHAFVDRIEDNAPVDDAVLSVNQADGAVVPLERATSGFFVAPFNHDGRLSDRFTIAVQSTAGSGSVPAELTYGDVASRTEAPPDGNFEGKISIALVSTAIGAAGATMVGLWTRHRRQTAADRILPVA